MIRVLTSRPIAHNNAIISAIRGIASSPSLWKKKMPDRPPLVDESEFTEAFIHGSGPGGQKINKTSSAVQLRHLPTGIVLKVQATRSRSQNRKIAREMLALKVEELEKGDKSRVAVVKATKIKRKGSKVKKSKRKYRGLEEARRVAAGEEVERDEEDQGVDEDGEGEGEEGDDGEEGGEGGNKEVVEGEEGEIEVKEGGDKEVVKGEKEVVKKSEEAVMQDGVSKTGQGEDPRKAP